MSADIRSAAIQQAVDTNDTAAIPFLWEALNDKEHFLVGAGPFDLTEFIAEAAMIAIAKLEGYTTKFVEKLKVYADCHPERQVRDCATRLLVKADVIDVAQLKTQMWFGGAQEDRRSFFAICWGLECSDELMQKIAQDEREDLETRRTAQDAWNSSMAKKLRAGDITLAVLEVQQGKNARDRQEFLRICYAAGVPEEFFLSMANDYREPRIVRRLARRFCELRKQEAKQAG